MLPNVLKQRLVDADAKGCCRQFRSFVGIPKAALVRIWFLSTNRRGKIVGVNNGEVFAGYSGRVFPLDVDVEAAYAVESLPQVFVVLPDASSPSPSGTPTPIPRQSLRIQN